MEKIVKLSQDRLAITKIVRNKMTGVYIYTKSGRIDFSDTDIEKINAIIKPVIQDSKLQELSDFMEVQEEKLKVLTNKNK